MEMQMEINAGAETTLERLSAAAAFLEQALERLSERQTQAESTIEKIAAALEAKLAAAATKLTELEASGRNIPHEVTNGRKTLPAGMISMLAKQGVAIDSIEAGALDAALTSLSIEQRIAVKSQLLRAGMLA